MDLTVNTGSAFARMRNNNQIKHVYNFISKIQMFNNISQQSRNQLLRNNQWGGYLDGTFVGAAPDADFYLYATEDGTKKFRRRIILIQAAKKLIEKELTSFLL